MFRNRRRLRRDKSPYRLYERLRGPPAIRCPACGSRSSTHAASPPPLVKDSALKALAGLYSKPPPCLLSASLSPKWAEHKSGPKNHPSRHPWPSTSSHGLTVTDTQPHHPWIVIVRWRNQFGDDGGVSDYNGGKPVERIKGWLSEFAAQRILKIICSVLKAADIYQ